MAGVGVPNLLRIYLQGFTTYMQFLAPYYLVLYIFFLQRIEDGHTTRCNLKFEARKAWEDSGYAWSKKSLEKKRITMPYGERDTIVRAREINMFGCKILYDKSERIFNNGLLFVYYIIDQKLQIYVVLFDQLAHHAGQ
ncbi:hypothetical protein ACJX0J_018382 [Zea mays]